MNRATALAGIVAISFSAIFVRLADAAPSTSALYRTLYAIPVLVVADRITARERRPWRIRALAGAAGVLLAVDLNLWHRAIVWIGAGAATVLSNLHVVFVGLAAWALYGERPSAAAVVTVPIGLGGVALISGLGRADAFGTNPIAGAIAGAAGGIAYAGFLLALRHATRRRRDAPAGLLLDVTLGATAANLAAALWAGTDLGPSWPSHGWLIMLALGSQVTGWLLITTALPRLPGLETALLLLVQPVLTVVWAQALFDEPLSWVQWGGVVLVLSGILTTSLRGAVESER